MILNVITDLIIHQKFLLVHYWYKGVTWLNIPAITTGEYQYRYASDIFQLRKLCVLQKIYEGYLKTHYSLHFVWQFAPILSVPQSLQFFSSYALRKLLASENRYCLWPNMQGYFRAKWRLLFISNSQNFNGTWKHSNLYLMWFLKSFIVWVSAVWFYLLSFSFQCNKPISNTIG